MRPDYFLLAVSIGMSLIGTIIFVPRLLGAFMYGIYKDLGRSYDRRTEPLKYYHRVIYWSLALMISYAFMSMELYILFNNMLAY